MSCNKHTSSKRNCTPRKNKLFSQLKDIVDDYIAEVRPGAALEFSFYASCSSLAETIRTGANAIRIDGKRHDHQRRIPAQSLAAFGRRLVEHEADIRAIRTFSDLHTLITQLSANIYRIGPLAVYDTATRIGAKLNLLPKEIYLHAGTRKGAEALGIDSKLESVSASILPPEFNRLTPSEIEDVLCMYKSNLRRLLHIGEP
jgi:hypothetical protein